MCWGVRDMLLLPPLPSLSPAVLWVPLAGAAEADPADPAEEQPSALALLCAEGVAWRAEIRNYNTEIHRNKTGCA